MSIALAADANGDDDDAKTVRRHGSASARRRARCVHRDDDRALVEGTRAEPTEARDASEARRVTARAALAAI
jgi:hypothetical protein